MKTSTTIAGLSLMLLLAGLPASAQELRPNQFGIGDIVSILGGGNRGGYYNDGYGYPNQRRGGIDASDLIGIASIIYQATQQNRQPNYYPQPGYYPQPQPGYYPNQYPPQYPANYPYQQPQYYPPRDPYYR